MPPQATRISRVQLSSRPRAPLRAITTHVAVRPRPTSTQRHNAALALDALRRSEGPQPRGASELESASRRHTPAAAEIVPLRPPVEGRANDPIQDAGERPDHDEPAM